MDNLLSAVFGKLTPRFVSIVVTVLVVVVLCFAAVFVAGAAFDRDVDLWGAKLTHRETMHEKNCREMQEAI